MLQVKDALAAVNEQIDEVGATDGTVAREWQANKQIDEEQISEFANQYANAIITTVAMTHEQGPEPTHIVAQAVFCAAFQLGYTLAEMREAERMGL